MALEKLGVRATVEDLNSFVTDLRKMYNEVEETGEKIEDAGKSTESFDQTFRKVGAAIGTVTAAIYTAKKYFDFAEEGAQLLRLEQAGENLAKSFGTSMDAIVDAVGKAANGTVARTDIIASANRAMLLGVADSADEMAKLMEVASARGKAMGLSTTQAFNDIVTGIGRASPMILDNLGIVTGGEQVYVDFAESIGKAKDELTDAEKKTALFNAVMESSEQILADAKKEADDAASSFERFKTNIKNATDEQKKMLGIKLAPFLDEINDQLERHIRLQEDLDQLNLRIVGGYRGVVTVLDEYGNVVDMNYDSITELAQAERDKREADLELLRIAKEKINLGEEEGITLEELTERNKELAEEEEKRTKALEELLRKRSEALIQAQYDELKTLLSTDVTGAIEDYQRALEGVSERESQLRERIADVNKEISGYRKEIQNIKDEEGPVTEEQQKQIDRYKERIAEANETIGELRSELGEIPDAVKEVEDAWDKQTKKMIYDLTAQRLAADGLTSEELKALGKLAGPDGFNLIDEASQILIEGIALAADEMDKAGDQSDILLGMLQGLQQGFYDSADSADALADALARIQIEKFRSIFGPDAPGAERRYGSEYRYEEDLPGGLRLLPRSGDTVTNEGDNYNLTINTSAPAENVWTDFRMMRALGGRQ